MTHSFLSEINSTITLPMEAIPVLEENHTLKSYAKGDPFLKAGQKNTILGFLEKGLLRSYFIDDKGNEVTTAFIEEGTFFTDVMSFPTQGISERTLEAVVASEVVVFSQQQLQVLRTSIAVWEQFERLYYQKVLQEKVAFQRKLTQSNVNKAYRLFVAQYKQAAKYAPRKQIASFLGISRYTLSRIKL